MALRKAEKMFCRLRDTMRPGYQAEAAWVVTLGVARGDHLGFDCQWSPLIFSSFSFDILFAS